MKRVRILVFSQEQQKILFGLTNDSNKWGFPGGAMEPNQDTNLIDTVYRELNEETSIKLDKNQESKLFTLNKLYFSEKHNVHIYYIILYKDVEMNYLNDKDQEFKDLKYCGIDEIKNLENIFEDVKIYINDFLSIFLDKKLISYLSNN